MIARRPMPVFPWGYFPTYKLKYFVLNQKTNLWVNAREEDIKVTPEYSNPGNSKDCTFSRNLPEIKIYLPEKRGK